MKLYLWIIIIVALLLTVNVYAHGDEEHSSDTFQILQVSISLKQVALLGIAVFAASVFTAAIWFMTGRQMPAMLLVATLLTALAGFIHLAVGRTGEWLLLVNGAGFCVIAIWRSLTFIRTSKYSKPVTLGLMIYTILTFVGYFLTHNQFDIVGVSSKIVEVALFIVLLRQLMLSQQQDSSVRNISASPAT